MKEFFSAFTAVYSGLYAGTIAAPGAAAAFDHALATSPAFKSAVLAFNAYRRDAITSDREAAAFWITWKVGKDHAGE